MSDRKYLMHFNGKGRILETAPQLWEAAQAKFLVDAGGREGNHQWPDTIDIHDFNYAAGVPFDEWLCGSAGAGFAVIQLPGITDEQVKAAKDQLRRDRDVVSLKVIKIKELI